MDYSIYLYYLQQVNIRLAAEPGRRKPCVYRSEPDFLQIGRAFRNKKTGPVPEPVNDFFEANRNSAYSSAKYLMVRTIWLV